jgi:hypothetical protein
VTLLESRSARSRTPLAASGNPLSMVGTLFVPSCGNIAAADPRNRSIGFLKTTLHQLNPRAQEQRIRIAAIGSCQLKHNVGAEGAATSV